MHVIHLNYVTIFSLVESFNQTLQNMVVKYIKQRKDKWEDYLDTCVFSYNTSKQDSIQHSPFELVFAWKPVLPFDINTEEKDPDTLLKNFSEAKDLSPAHTQQLHDVHYATLDVAKKRNVLKAQKTQKEQHDK